jgi:ankyrin repeat protein
VFAVERNWATGVGALIAAGASLDAKSERGDTALMNACILRAVDMIPRLLEAGADLETTNKLGATPLLYVCRLGAGYANTVTATQSHPDGSTEERTITPEEVRASYLEVLRLLIARGARLDARDPGGFAGLHHVAEAGNVAFARALLEAGADAAAADIDGFTPLHVAALKGDAAMTRLLLDHGARREAAVTTAWKDVAVGMTPLDIATLRGHTALVSVLARTE